MDAVFAKVERLLLNHVVLTDISVLGRPQERFDALGVVAEGEDEVCLCCLNVARVRHCALTLGLIFLLI